MKEQVIQVMTDFVRGGDNSDITLLSKVLHKEFRVTNNGFMNKPGVTIINKDTYLSYVKAGIFGGTPREMTMEIVDLSDGIAMVKLRLESMENHFVSYNSLVLDKGDQWKIINNLAVVEAKK